MTTSEAHPVFAPLSADDADNQVTEMESLCMNCYEKGHTRLLLTRIPYYKDVILSSFECDSCHFKNNDIQPAQRVETHGIRIIVQIKNAKDLNRQLVKSGYGTIRIKELDFEQTPQNESGLLTTIEGFLNTIIENINKTMNQIEEMIDDVSKTSTADSVKPDVSHLKEQKDKLSDFVKRVESFKSLSQAFHFEIDDPSGNSFIENPNAPHRDEQLTVKNYRRTPEQNELLGISNEEEEDKTPIPEDAEQSIQDEVLVFSTNCPNCNAPCDTNMKLTEIPYFKEAIIMATSCDVCGHKSNEVKSGSGIAAKGIRYTLTMIDSTDLNRDILVSETSSFAIPDLDFELSESRSIGGKFSTLEGIFTTLKTQLRSVIMPFSGGDSHDDKSDQNRMSSFIRTLSAILAGEKFVTIVLDDPAGNCYLQNVYAPESDPNLTVEHYERTAEQNELLGLADMNVDHYSTAENENQ